MGNVPIAEVDFVLVVGFPAGAFHANCYVVALGADRECVIVDPGEGAPAPVADAIGEHRLTPAAVLATHGHVDHIHSAAELADGHGIPMWIKREDRPLLSDPAKGIGAELAAAVSATGLALDVREPAEVAEFDDLDPLDETGDVELAVAGLRIRVCHTPGHTPGSVVFRLRTGEGASLAFTGDTLFAGSVGRSDLPGGDVRELARSLRTTLWPLADDTVVLPGHGPSTTIGTEKTGNPYFGAGRGQWG